MSKPSPPARSPDWVLLSYRLPREPSTPRISVWRKLKRLGVVQVGDGLVALPHDERTLEQLDWIAEEVVEANGTAIVWVGRPTSAESEQDLVAMSTEARTAEYLALIAEANESAGLDEPGRRAVGRRLRGEFRRVVRRDYFPTSQQRNAQVAIADLVGDNHDDVRERV